MNTAKKTSLSLLTGLLVFLASLALPINTASAGMPTNKSTLPYTVTEQEMNELLAYASIDENNKIESINIKIYGPNDELVYSAKVCHTVYNCDERLNQLINQSDFITEVDNIRIYILSQ